MSLDTKNKLRVIAKETGRKLRQNQTRSEKIIWNILRNRKILNRKFYRQFPVFYDLTGKESFYVCDFYCHELKLVIEIDGKIHDFNKSNDKLRDSIMNILGLHVLRIKNEEIENSISKVIDKIKNSITKLENQLTHPKSLSSKERDF